MANSRIFENSTDDESRVEESLDDELQEEKKSGILTKEHKEIVPEPNKVDDNIEENKQPITHAPERNSKISDKIAGSKEGENALMPFFSKKNEVDEIFENNKERTRHVTSASNEKNGAVEVDERDKEETDVKTISNEKNSDDEVVKVDKIKD